MSRPSSRFVEGLTPTQISHLKSLQKEGETSRIRQRAHAILLSSQRTTIGDLTQIFQTSRNTICKWLDRWETEKLAGIADKPRPGAPPMLNEQEQARALELLRETPQSIDRVLLEIQKETGILISSDTLKRIAKKAGWSWKRMRKSLRSKQDQKKTSAST